MYTESMKTEQLQLRVSPELKAAIRKSANEASMDMSEWILAKLFPAAQDEFQNLVENVWRKQDAPERSYSIASISDFLHRQSQSELAKAVAEAPRASLNEFMLNYLAAMVEHACHQKKVSPPEWIRRVEGVATPYFGSPLISLRLHLMTNSPAAFRKRNLFVDSTLGDRI